MDTSDNFQKSSFLQAEGDQWFRRNKQALGKNSPFRGAAVARLAHHLPGAAPAQVLEIGCGDGSNLVMLGQHRPIMAAGIDPSAEAVEHGRKTHPGLDLRQGTADSLPFADGQFDMVLFGFCLYLIDRALLFQVAHEADRVLKKEGTLAIIDFDPPQPMVRPYHHRPGINSYKQDYSQVFLASAKYTLAEKLPGNHVDAQWHPDGGERTALWICRKSHIASIN